MKKPITTSTIGLISLQASVGCVAYHRNGIGGEGFHVVAFQVWDEGKERRLIGVVFPLQAGETSNGRVAVFDRELLSLGEITFGVNSFRGDNFEPYLRAVIADYEAAENARAVGVEP